MHYLSEEAVTPDRRRYATPDEAPRHYIDLDYYGEIEGTSWDQVGLCYPRDSVSEHGILPWHILRLRYSLVQAFRDNHVKAILRLSADAGHYLADAHVPLHTTVNYNGQLTDQQGIHGFWETRVPELLYDHFDLWTGQAIYIPAWEKTIWAIVMKSHQAVDSVLVSEKLLTQAFSDDRKYSFEVRIGRMVKVYSREFTRSYHKVLNDQVERHMRAAILCIGNFWYSCWVDAGQPDLDSLIANRSIYTTDYQIDMDSIWRYQHAPRK